jgi:hypothetical protein
MSPASIIAALLLAAGALPTPDEALRALRASGPLAVDGVVLHMRADSREPGGPTRTLAFTLRTRHTAVGLDARLDVTGPPDLAGAAFLIRARPDESERWLSLPGLSRPRRILGASRAGAFLGTHLSYADLDRDYLAGAVARNVRREPRGERPAVRLEADLRGDGAYAALSAWLREGDLLPLAVELRAPGGAPVRTLEASEFRWIQRSWVAVRSRVVEHASGGETVLVLEKVEVATAPASLFTPDALSAHPENK